MYPDPQVRPILPSQGVFDRVVVTPHMRNGAVVSWWLDSRRFTAEGPYVFFLEWSEYPEGDFTTVAGPTTGSFLADPHQRRFSKLPFSCYRVRLETPHAIYYSAAEQTLGTWNRHDYNQVRELCRRELLVQRKFAGINALYFCRKQWGEYCSVCRDQLTGEVTNSHCPTCYGTGYVGGYHDPFYLWISVLDRGPTRGERQENIGVAANQTFTGKTLAYPFLVSKDVLVDTGSDERYSVESVKEAGLHRGRAVFYRIELRLIEPDNIVYTLPLPSDGSSSSSSSSSSGTIEWPTSYRWLNSW